MEICYSHLRGYETAPSELISLTFKCRLAKPELVLNLLHCNFIIKGAMCVCLYSELQLDAGVLHDHLIKIIH